MQEPWKPLKTVLTVHGHREVQISMKVISWNMAGRLQPWKCLLDMDVDLALLQEATEPPADVAERIRADSTIEVDAAPWETMIVGARPRYKTAIVKLSNRIELDRIEAKPLEVAESRELVASWPGTLTAAVITPQRAQTRKVAVSWPKA